MSEHHNKELHILKWVGIALAVLMANVQPLASRTTANTQRERQTAVTSRF